MFLDQNQSCEKDRKQHTNKAKTPANVAREVTNVYISTTGGGEGSKRLFIKDRQGDGVELFVVIIDCSSPLLFDRLTDSGSNVIRPTGSFQIVVSFTIKVIPHREGIRDAEWGSRFEGCVYPSQFIKQEAILLIRLYRRFKLIVCQWLLTKWRVLGETSLENLSVKVLQYFFHIFRRPRRKTSHHCVSRSKGDLID